MKTLMIFVVLHLVLMPMRAYADSPLQGLGGKIGINYATWARKGDMPGFADRTYISGLTGGAALHLRRWKPLSPQLELLFTPKGTGAEIGGVSQGQFNLYYIDMLILARAELPIEPVILFAVAGPEASFLLKSTFTDPNGLTEDRTGFRRIDLGVVAGAGVAFGPFSWGTLTLEARYAMGFINVDANPDDASLTNRTVSFMLGYEYRRARDKALGSK